MLGRAHVECKRCLDQILTNRKIVPPCGEEYATICKITILHKYNYGMHFTDDGIKLSVKISFKTFLIKLNIQLL